MLSQIGFKSGGFLWEPVQTCFSLKSKNLLIISKQIVIVFSLLEITIHFFFFCYQFEIPWILCYNFTSHNFCHSPFPKHLARKFKIKWRATFKISYSQTFESIKNGLIPKKIPSLLQKPFQLLQPFGLKLHQNPLFLQTLPIKSICESSKNILLKLYHNFQTLMRTTMTQHQAQKIKTKTYVMDSHTLPLSNGNSSSIFKSLCTREIKIFKIPSVIFF